MRWSLQGPGSRINLHQRSLPGGRKHSRRWWGGRIKADPQCWRSVSTGIKKNKNKSKYCFTLQLWPAWIHLFFAGANNNYVFSILKPLPLTCLSGSIPSKLEWSEAIGNAVKDVVTRRATWQHSSRTFFALHLHLWTTTTTTQKEKENWVANQSKGKFSWISLRFPPSLTQFLEFSTAGLLKPQHCVWAKLYVQSLGFMY